ncbi:hypothetical protein KUTeg_011638 [Tegillarca granosa]|uniref:Uncharacterized protein n=1 Tax=Tegillarca granosa TaxID=220873 RepID=A0ABQ9EX75_TEGGR|nr:hypothetical protein KUTeg_011638 [Tegillarca granosa]
MATIKLVFVLFLGKSISGINRGVDISDCVIWRFKVGDIETAQKDDIGTKQNNISGPEVRHVAFFKVHKAASSTAMNIFLRFGYKRNLIFVLPSSDSNSVWQEPYLLKLPLHNPVYNLLKYSELYEPENPVESWTNNRQSVDFGFPSDLFKNSDPSKIHTYLQQLNSDFRLVMIAEYFDESVILLRRYVNWTMKDILYISKNIQRYNRRPFKSEYELRYLHRLRAPLDYALYDFFIKVFWQKVSQEGGNFHEEVVYFRKLRLAVENFCRQNTREPKITFTATESRWHELFTIQNEDCNLLLTPEVTFTEIIRYKQYPEIRTKLWPKPKNIRRYRKGRGEALGQQWINQNDKIFRQKIK